MKLYSAAQVRELDRIAIEDHGVPGLTLMKRAAEACVEVLLNRWPSPGSVSIICGSGNNAADGFIIAGLLKSRNVQTKVGLVGRVPTEPAKDATEAYRYCVDSGVEIVAFDDAIADADLVVDALLGTGLRGDLRSEYQEAIARINQASVPVLAVDVPSGLCSDTGRTLGAAVKADCTVTFIGRKLGLMTNDGQEHLGSLHFSDLSVPKDIYDGVDWLADQVEYESLVDKIPKRHRNSHKVRHGHLLIVAGGEGMAGAAILAAEAAIYAGAGLVTVATHPDNVSAIISRRPEVMARGVSLADELDPLLERATGIVMGPGLGTDEWAQRLLDRVIGTHLPKLIDADGLNLICDSGLHRDDWILTPHPGEAYRLIDMDIQSDRLAAVKELQKRYGGVALLKGSGTLICDGEKPILNPYGNPGMAVAGMGDVLSGVIGSLMVQGLSLSAASRIGSVVHALAADRLVAEIGERGLLASELPPVIRTLLNSSVAE